jgi:hypothetical protein
MSFKKEICMKIRHGQINLLAKAFWHQFCRLSLMEEKDEKCTNIHPKYKAEGNRENI